MSADKPRRKVRPSHAVICRVTARDEEPMYWEPIIEYVTSAKAVDAVLKGKHGSGTFRVVTVREPEITMEKQTKEVWGRKAEGEGE